MAELQFIPVDNYSPSAFVSAKLKKSAAHCNTGDRDVLNEYVRDGILRYRYLTAQEGMPFELLPAKGENSFSLLRSLPDEQLLIAGKTVIHSFAGVSKRRITLDYPIRCATFASFFASSPFGDHDGASGEPSKFAHRMARSLCILHERGLFLQSEDGDCVDLPLPYPIRWIRPFPLGLLLEADQEAKDGFGCGNVSGDPFSFARSGDGNGSALADECGPQLFSLVNPLKEIRPLAAYDTSLLTAVEQKRNTILASPTCPEDTPDTWVSNTHLITLLCQANHPYTLVYDRKSKVHALLVLRGVTHDPKRKRDYQRAKLLKREMNRYLSSQNKPLDTPMRTPSLSTPSVQPAISDDFEVLREEMCMRADVYAEVVHVSKQADEMASAAFFSHNCSGELCVCMVISGKLIGWALEEHLDAVSVASTFVVEDVVDASPILCTQRYCGDCSTTKHLDFLTLNSNGEVHLHNGRSQPLCRVSSYALTSLLRRSDSPPIDDEVVLLSPATTVERQGPSTIAVEINALRDGYSSVSIGVKGSSELRRVRLPLFPVSRVMGYCLNVLNSVLPDDIMAEVFAQCFIESERSDSSGSMCERELSTLCDVLLGAAQEDNASDVVSAGAASDWEKLLNSNFHHQNRHANFLSWMQEEAPGAVETGKHYSGNPRLAAYMSRIVEALHNVVEEAVANTLLWSDLRYILSSLLAPLAAFTGWGNHLDYYYRLLPSLVSYKLPQPSSDISVPEPPVYSLLSHLEMLMSGDDSLNHRTFRSLKISDDLVQLYRMRFCELRPGERDIRPDESKNDASFVLPSALGDGPVHYPVLDFNSERPVKTLPALNDNASVQEIVTQHMVALGWDVSLLDTVAFGVSLPLRECLQACQASPPAAWNAASYLLVGRDDLAKDLEDWRNVGRVSILDETKFSLGKSAPARERGKRRRLLLESGDGFADSSTDLGGIDARKLSALRFPSDLRVYHVGDMLHSATASHLSLTEEELRGLNDHDILGLKQMKLWANAQRTMALSLGRGALTLCSSYPVLTEALPIPNLAVSGVFHGNKTATTLELALLPADFCNWPLFHNGVASALRIARDEQPHNITSSWIIFNRPPSGPSAAHAGFLFAMGILRHLSALSLTKIFEYLSEAHELTSVGLLLGLAATHQGSLTESVAKLLSIHVPALHPPASTDLEVPCSLQCAAVMGLGLLYQESGHRRMTEVLLDEIGILPTEDKNFNRHCYSLSAGLALGMISLGKGNQLLGLADLKLVDKLMMYVKGGPRNKIYTKASQRLFNFDASKEEFVSATGLIVEKSFVNTDITAPSATMALAMIFLKTNDQVVAKRISLPNSIYELEAVRPSVMLLRTLAKNLILWDEIKCTREWIDDQIPSVIQQRIAGIPKDSSPLDPTVYDAAYFKHCEINILTGACMVIGLRFAGTKDENARDLLLQYLETVENLNGKKQADGRTISNNAVETCIGSIAIAASIVMAGSGDLPVLRVLRRLRNRNPFGQYTSNNPTVGSSLRRAVGLPYGSHVAIAMALGFTFLGGGRMSFMRSTPAIGALLCAIYPVFPFSSSDNIYHLQALRHFYVLAAEDRCLATVDVDTNAAVPLKIAIRCKADNCADGYTEHMTTTPALLPELEEIVSIHISSHSHWDRDLNMSVASQVESVKSGVIYVKKKSQVDALKQELAGLQLSAPAGHEAKMRGLLKSLMVQAMGEQRSSEIWDHISSNRLRLRPEGGNLHAAMSAMVFQCMAAHQTVLLGAYINLLSAAAELNTGNFNTHQHLAAVHHYAFALSVAAVTAQVEMEGQGALQLLVADARRSTCHALMGREPQLHPLLLEYVQHGRMPSAASDALLLASFLVCAGVPRRADVVALRHRLAALQKADANTAQLLVHTPLALMGELDPVPLQMLPWGMALFLRCFADIES